MSQIDPRLYDVCRMCGGAGKKPSRTGMATCAPCEGTGVVPKNRKDPTWGAA